MDESGGASVGKGPEGGKQVVLAMQQSGFSGDVVT